MNTTPTYRILPYNLASPYFAGAVHLYAATWGHDLERAYNFCATFARSYPLFVGLVAVRADDDAVIGFGFGTRSLAGQWWHDQVARQIGDGHPALQDAWVLTELAVADGYRGLGIGGRLHDALIAGQPCPRLLLSTQIINTRAQAFYLARGWQFLHPGFAFEQGAPQYAIMSRAAT